MRHAYDEGYSHRLRAGLALFGALVHHSVQGTCRVRAMRAVTQRIRGALRAGGKSILNNLWWWGWRFPTGQSTGVAGNVGRAVLVLRPAWGLERCAAALFCRTYHCLSEPKLCAIPGAFVWQYGGIQSDMSNGLYRGEVESFPEPARKRPYQGHPRFPPAWPGGDAQVLAGECAKASSVKLTNLPIIVGHEI